MQFSSGVANSMYSFEIESSKEGGEQVKESVSAGVSVQASERTR